MYTPDAARRLAAAHEALDLATEHGDPTLLAQVAPAVLYALWEPGRRELRSRVAAQAIRAAESTGDPRLEFSAHLSAYNMAVESADHAVAARSLARMRAIAHAVAEPRLRWTAGLYDTFDATMAGRLDDAEALATANLDLGMQIGAPDAFTFFAGQLFVIGTFARPPRGAAPPRRTGRERQPRRRSVQARVRHHLRRGRTRRRRTRHPE